MTGGGPFGGFPGRGAGSGAGVGMNRPLMRATRLKQNGNFRMAAELFERLSETAQQRGRPKRAGHLYLQAAHCRLLAGQRDRGIELLNQGMHLLEQTQSWPALHRIGPIMVSELERLGYAEAARTLQAWLEQVLKGHPMPAVQPAGILPGAPGAAQAYSPRLPASCPACGAPVRPDQTSWIDNQTAECLYCGGILQTA